MRISDWSSDVCSSDLGIAEVALHHVPHIDGELLVEGPVEAELLARPLDHLGWRAVADDGQYRIDRYHAAHDEGHQQQTEDGQQQGGSEIEKRAPRREIGSTSGRERVCQ